MSGYVYILQSVKGYYYIGSTSDLRRRLKEHEAGYTLTTKRFKDVSLVFYREFDTLNRARKIERKLKSW